MSTAPIFDTAVFDLDGTLLNSLEDLAVSANFALQCLGYPTRSLEEVRQFVGNGGRMLMIRALPAQASPETVQQAFEIFAKHYEQHMRDHTRPYPGIEALLSEMARRGIRMAVVSNKMNEAVGPLVKGWFGGWIPVAVGEGEQIPKKPAPQGVWRALSLLGSCRERSLYLGDSDVDVVTARNAGLYAVGCSWGFRDRTVLEQAGADRIIDRPEELLSLFSAEETKRTGERIFPDFGPDGQHRN
ncbi:MAG: HAD family hydrolase [Oscillospiraceae bacterium]|nr:MAG: HAD family hydrolase [Oscillospiraceae bacterium]